VRTGHPFDPLVAEWIAEIQGDRHSAEQEVVRTQPIGRSTKEQVRELLGEFATVLTAAGPKRSRSSTNAESA
jgi:hypothetical protein